MHAHKSRCRTADTAILQGQPGMYAKRAPCKFWQEGTCAKGNACLFAHKPVADSERATFSDHILQERPACRHWQNGYCQQGMACKFAHAGCDVEASDTSSESPRERAEIKRIICSFWKDGCCRHGDRCTFAHGEHEIGTTAEIAVKTEQKIVSNCAYVQGKMSQRRESELQLTRSCKYWESGHCKLGDSCAFAHNRNIRTDDEPLAGTMPCVNWKAGNCKHGAFCAYVHDGPKAGKRDRPSVDEERKKRRTDGVRKEPPKFKPLAPLVPSQASAAVATAKESLCAYWESGFCRASIWCDFAHGEEQVGKAAAEKPVVKWALCRYWEDGYCGHGTSCSFAHGIDEIGQVCDKSVPVRRNAIGKPVPVVAPVAEIKRALCMFAQGSDCTFAQGEAKKRPACRYWAGGHCRNGSTCTFLHEKESHVKWAKSETRTQSKGTEDGATPSKAKVKNEWSESKDWKSNGWNDWKGNWQGWKDDRKNSEHEKAEKTWEWKHGKNEKTWEWKHEKAEKTWEWKHEKAEKTWEWKHEKAEKTSESRTKGSEQKTKATKDAKRCEFWLNGSCKKGWTCDFKHE